MSSPFGNDDQTFYDKDGLPIPPPINPVPMYSHQHATPHQPPHGRQYVTPARVYGQKSQVVAALLAFFLGTWGAHNFYLGYTRRGVAQLATTVVGWTTLIFLIGGVFLAVVGVWAFIEFILILLRSGSMGVDARGVPLS